MRDGISNLRKARKMLRLYDSFLTLTAGDKWWMFRIGYVYITYNKYVNGGLSLILNLILNFRDLMLALYFRDIFVPVYHSGTKPFVVLGVF